MLTHSERPSVRIAWAEFGCTLPKTARYIRLQVQHYHLRRLNARGLLSVWDELGQVVGVNGTLLVAGQGVRLTANSQFIPTHPNDQELLRTKQGAAYACLQAAVSAHAADVRHMPAFNLLLPALADNEPAAEAIRQRIPTLPEGRTMGILSFRECQSRFPHAARFLARRTQERQIEAKLARLRAGVVAELQGAGYAFDRNLQTTTPGGILVTLALYLQPDITLHPDATSWARRLNEAKAAVAPFISELRQKNLLTEEKKPSVTISSAVPSRYTALPPMPTAQPARAA